MDMADTKRMAIAFRAAQASQESFEKFLDDGKGKLIKGKEGIAMMRDAGVQIEEQ